MPPFIETSLLLQPANAGERRASPRVHHVKWYVCILLLEPLLGTATDDAAQMRENSCRRSMSLLTSTGNEEEGEGG